MAMNLIQFQRGMSLPEFQRSFGTVAQCTEALRVARWPNGFRCPRCGAAEHCRLGRGELYQCNACRGQTSLVAGTLMANTKLALPIWLLAIYLISQAKTGLSALALKRQLGVSYPTAWLMHHKILHAMAQRDTVHRLGGHVQLDDAYLGGEHAGGKPGRGSQNKVPFVAAVSMSDAGQPRYLKLTPVAGFTHEAIKQWAGAHLHPGTRVASDGLACFTAVREAGCEHQHTVVGSAKPRDLPQFKWVNTVLGNLKTSLSGTHHAFKFTKYAAAYLAAFAYRFNRRFDLRGLVARLIIDVTNTHPIPQHVIRAAETRC
jgi:transposase-like protein